MADLCYPNTPPCPHPVDLERNAVQAITVLIQLVLPSARFLDRLDQLDVDLSQMEEGALCTGSGWLVLVFGVRDINGVGDHNLGHG